jgi:hypothetical protein
MKKLNSTIKQEMLVLCGIIFASLMSLNAQGQTKPSKDVNKQNSTASNVEAPVLVAPADKAVLKNFPRETEFKWKAVPGAKEYEVKVEFNDGQWKVLKNEKVAGLSVTATFPGDNPGRWHVRAVLENGTFTRWSNRTFSYNTSSTGAANDKKPKGKPVADQNLGIPQLLGPADGTTFSVTPRKTKFDWSTVEGANAYEIQVEYKAGSEWKLLKGVNQKGTSFTTDFVGAQPGRWRVCAIAEGKKGPFSKWCMFSYTK